MRLNLLKKIISILFFFLTIGLAYSQIIKGPHYFKLAQNNRIKLIRLSAPRGLIYDCKNKVLAGHRLVFNVAVLAQETEDVRQVLKDVSPILNITQEELWLRFKKNFRTPFIPAVVAYNIPKRTAILLESKEPDIPGLIIQPVPLRDYRYGESLGHILGYLGNPDREDLKKLREYGLEVADLIGKSGLEREFDYYLRGKDGGMQIEVNNLGYKVRVLGLREPTKGEDLYLTIDIQLQQFIDDLLKGKKGASIVMDPRNGEIRALVSKPGFDPNLFIAALNGGLNYTQRIKKILNSEEAVLFNRAISGVYPPGSVFKIVVAAAGLETGRITPERRFNCTGSLKVGDREFFCWKLDGHGMEDIYSAISHSCNIYFYKLGLGLGPDQISLFARKFGLGKPSGIDLPYESKGLVPSKSWKFKTYKEGWYDGETVNFSIGQGYLLVTPLQIAQMISIIANGGYLVRPHLIRRIGDSEYNVFRRRLNLKEETLEIIKEGMRQVIDDREGTGHRANIAGVQWAAKTGTAQTSRLPPHGWFGGFYPFDQPRVVVLVFLENGGCGGEAPAEIAKKIIEWICENEE